MNNTFGTKISVTIFGESHGPAIGCVVDGLQAGLPVDTAVIDRRLAMRRPQGAICAAGGGPLHHRERRVRGQDDRYAGVHRDSE